MLRTVVHGAASTVVVALRLLVGADFSPVFVLYLFHIFFDFEVFALDQPGTWRLLHAGTFLNEHGRVALVVLRAAIQAVPTADSMIERAAQLVAAVIAAGFV